MKNKYNGYNLIVSIIKMLWIDKYKPRKLDDVVMNDEIRHRLKQFIENNTIPNLIMIGSTGIGKTSILDCVARELYKERINEYVLKLNSSLDKNMKNIQDLFDGFCNKMMLDKTIRKMIIINDIDNIPQKIQNVISAYIEKYKNICFVFSCNDVDVIDILQSNCIIIKLYRVNDEFVENKLKQICECENCEYSDNAIKHLCFLSQYDIRIAINMMQVICESFGLLSIENIDKLSDIPNSITLNKIIENCIQKNTVESLNIGLKLLDDGYACSDILNGLFDIIKSNDCKINENEKVKLLTTIGKIRYNVSKKVDSKLQLMRCIIKMCK